MKHLICVECGQEHLTHDGRPSCRGHKEAIIAEKEAILAARYKRPPRPERPREPCHCYPINGTTSCRMHGRGSQVKAAAARKVKMAKAELVVDTYGLPRDVPADVALIEEIARTNGHVHWLGGIVARLQQDDLTWGTTSHEQGVGAEGPIDKTTHTANVNTWLSLYQAERTHLVKVCKEAIHAGIAEREVRLAEQQGQMVAQLLRSVFADPELGLTPVQALAARKVASRHLRLVDSA